MVKEPLCITSGENKNKYYGASECFSHSNKKSTEYTVLGKNLMQKLHHSMKENIDV